MTKVFVESYGCAANMAEGEIIKGLLAEEKYELGKKEEADVIILNVCTVKGNTPAMREIRKTHEQRNDAALIITGCVPRDMIKPVSELVPGASIVSTHNIKHMPTVVEETLSGNSVLLVEKTGAEKFLLPRIRKNPLVAILPISSGCDSACTFCSTKLIKGGHVSYPEEALVKEVELAVADGCKEVWLTGQDTGCWGLENGKTLPDLLRKLSAVPGEFKMRLGMANPKHMIRYADNLIDIYKTGKLYRFMHIPAQSGNDEVLKAMRRQHTVEEFIKFVQKMREALPDLTLSTDVIVGFPGETKEQFNCTIQLIEKIGFDLLNISRFVPRWGTVAEKMENQVHGRERKERSRIVTQVYEKTSLLRNQQWIGWEGEVLIDEQGKNGTWIGRNYAYKQVILNGDFELGKKVQVRITGATYHDLRGVALNTS